MPLELYLLNEQFVRENTCWDTRTMDSIIKSGQKDTEASVAKSVNKLLLAASASKARLIVVTWYFMLAFGLIFAVQHWNGPERVHYSNRTQTLGTKTGPLFESPPRPLLKSGMRPLVRGELPYEEYTGVCHELGSYFQEKFRKGYVNFSEKFRKGL